MVRGLDLFRERFRDFEGAFILIGGAACDEWFSSQGLTFRVTKDLDLVLIIEVVDASFVVALRAFIAEGKYEIRQRGGETPVLYRFAKPERAEFPFLLELFSRKPDGLDLADNQEITLIPAGMGQHSLSAILLHDDYYALIRGHREIHSGLPVAGVTALIPLKARAWLDLTRREAAGEKIDSKDNAKHRNDVFRLAGTLPGDPGPELAASIRTDLAEFLGRFTDDSGDWPAISDAVKTTLGGTIPPAALRSAIQTYFRLSPA